MKKFKPLTWEKEPILSKDLLHNLSSKELPQEFSKLVDENFDELIGEEPKKETLEEAAKEFVLSHDFSRITNPNHLANRSFQFGAKWQQERMYSEGDLREAFKQSRQCKIFEKDMPPVHNEFEDWFEQFKKK